MIRSTALSIRKCAGFTLIELMVVMTVIALLVSIAAPRYFDSVDRGREAALKENLQQMRAAIDRFHADRNRYPSSIEELVEQRYLRRVPVDPMTDRSDGWIKIAAKDAPSAGIVDVRSGAPGRAADGTSYASW